MYIYVKHIVFQQVPLASGLEICGEESKDLKKPNLDTFFFFFCL